MYKISTIKWYYFAASILVLIIIFYEAQGKGDFFIFRSASTDLFKGENIYQNRYNGWYHYYYDVVFALLLAPFAFLPLYVIKVLWLLLNVFFVYRIWQIFLTWLPVPILPEKRRILFGVLSFVFVMAFLRDNFHLSQVTIFVLYLTLEGLFLIGTNRRIAGGLLIALGITVKILPLLMLPYLIYRNEWKASAYIILFVIVLLIAPGILIGMDYNNFLLLERWKLINPSNQRHILDTTERSFHSLTTLFATLLVKNCGDVFALPLRRNIADITLENLGRIINLTRLSLVLFTLYFLQGKPFRACSSSIQRFYELSYICLLIPLIFPHQQHYAFFFIFPATTYLLFFLLSTYSRKDKKSGLIISLLIVYFLTNAHFILGQFNPYYDHFKILTYGALFLILLLALHKPARLLSLPESRSP